MLFSKKGSAPKMSVTDSVTIIMALCALLISIGGMRWSWLIMDEQIRLREDFEELKNDQEQTEVQYEFWLEKLQEEGRALREARE